jgi:hypothetical protein
MWHVMYITIGDGNRTELGVDYYLVNLHSTIYIRYILCLPYNDGDDGVG